MAVDASTFVTYAAIGNREDLEDVIYRIDPTDTWFVSNATKGKAKAVNHEWQTQALAAAAANAVLEGDDATTDAVTPTQRLGNICQISDKVARVSGTQEAVEHAGRDSEMNYQKTLKGLELKRDLEFILVGSNTAKNAGAIGTARLTASILSWIKTNNSSGASPGAAPATADGAATRTDGVQRAFTEALLKPVLQSIWTNGGDPGVILVGGFNKQAFSTFTGRSTPQENATSKKIVNTVDVYEGDFGTMKVIADRFMRSRDCLILDMDYWAVDYLRNMTSIELAKTGDSERRQVLCEYTLVSRNEKASGIVADLTTT